jgi:hypothetical protein
MGIYLNPGYENFRRTLSAQVYVDKTMMISELRKIKDICLSYTHWISGLQ